MRQPVFASIVATPSVTLPVAGTMHNTDTLLGHNGFVGVKTGSGVRPHRPSLGRAGFTATTRANANPAPSARSVETPPLRPLGLGCP